MVMYDTKINANLLRNTEDSHMIPAVYSIFRNSGYQDKEEVKVKTGDVWDKCRLVKRRFWK